MEVPGNMVTSTDTIYVYDYPQVPDLIYDTLNNLIYTNSSDFSMQWYYYNSPIPGATDTFVQPESSGLYTLVVVNEYGCTAFSLDVLVVICDADYQPILDNNGSTAWMLDSALYSNLQWYDQNGIIVGANQPFFPSTEAGMYYIVATDTFGCTYSSEAVFLGHSSLINFSASVRVGPNPFSSGNPLTIFLDNVQDSDVTVVLIDIYGRQVFQRHINSTLFPYKIESGEIDRIPEGLYYLEVSFSGFKISKKIIKLRSN